MNLVCEGGVDKGIWRPTLMKVARVHFTDLTFKNEMLKLIKHEMKLTVEEGVQ